MQPPYNVASVQAPEDMTPDHDPLDLARSLEDVVDLDVPEPLLDEVFPGVALRSHDLDGAHAGTKGRSDAGRRASSPPTMWSKGMRQSSKTSSAVSEAVSPSLCSIRPTAMPGVPLRTTKSFWPARPAPGSTVALTTRTSARAPLVQKTFVPLRTHSSPSRTAVVLRFETSDPAWASVTASAPQRGARPAKISVRTRRSGPRVRAARC